jgi:O-antigen ligase
MSSYTHLPTDEATKGRPWPIFAVLFATFVVVTPYDLSGAITARSDSGLYAIGTVDSKIQGVQEGRTGRKAGLLALSLLGAFLLTTKGPNSLQMKGLLGWLIIGFVLWAVLSVLWADDQHLTAKRVGAFLLLCLGVLGTAKRFSAKDIVGFALFASALTLAMGLGSELVYGAFRPLEARYRFSGIIHPNLQGANCAVLLIASLTYAKMVHRGRSWCYVAAIVAVTFLLLTKSRTATASALVAVTFFWILLTPTRRLVVGLGMAGILALPTSLICFHEFMSGGHNVLSLGREDAGLGTFMGRTDIWSFASQDVHQRPLLGYGYDATFTPRRQIEYYTQLGWAVSNPHSGYISIALDVGVLAVLIYCLAMLIAVARAAAECRVSLSVAHAFFAAMLVWLALENFLEDTALVAHIPCFCCMVILAKLAFVESRDCDGSVRLPPEIRN